MPGYDDGGFRTASNTQVTSTPASRLAGYFADPHSVPTRDAVSAAAPTWQGVDNPYGRGLGAYEPNTTPWIAQTQTAGSDVAKSTIDMPQGNNNSLTGLPSTGTTSGSKAGAMVPAGDYASGGVVDAHGMVQTMINAALSAASHNVPYVWGGTNLATGVDCSGLIFAAAKAAGIQGWQRYRAVDYGHMGTAVSQADARPGDVVYYDEGGGNGHVGLYLGNGMMVAAPQTGENVKVQKVYGQPTSIRRIFNDTSFTPTALPSGGTTYAYNGRPMSSPAMSTVTLNPATPAPAPPAPVFTPAPVNNIGHSRAV